MGRGAKPCQPASVMQYVLHWNEPLDALCEAACKAMIRPTT